MSLSSSLLSYEHRHVSCLRLHNDLLGDLLLRTSPYLFPFVVEYALIGATVALLMWRHSGRTTHEGQEDSAPVRLPDPKKFLSKGELHHSRAGAASGALIVLLAGVNLGLFFATTAEDGDKRKVRRHY